jgi:hypothetical protein
MNLPVDCVLSNRNCMQVDKQRQFWHLLSNKDSIKLIICDERLLENMEKRSDEVLTLYELRRKLVRLKYLYDIQWYNSDVVKCYKRILMKSRV